MRHHAVGFRFATRTAVPLLRRMASTTTNNSTSLLSQVESTVDKVLAAFPNAEVSSKRLDGQPLPKKRRKKESRDNGGSTLGHDTQRDLDSPSRSVVPESARAAVAVAQSLRARLDQLRRRNACERCWFSRPDACICDAAPPATEPPPKIIRRLFLLMHSKEIGMAVDTAKMILAAYPTHGRLVVAGIGPEYQDSMKELQEALQDHPSRCLVLFPSPQSTTASECVALRNALGSQDEVDVVVLDGTWKQARRIYHRYLEPVPDLAHICLTSAALEHISANEQSSKQLRHHPEEWREIGTCAATRYLLQDLEHLLLLAACPSSSSTTALPDYSRDHVLTRYQQIVNEAAHRQKVRPNNVSAC